MIPLMESDRGELRESLFAHPDVVRTLIGDGSTVEKQHELVDEWFESYASTWEQLGYGMWGIYRRNKDIDLSKGLIGIIWLEHTEDKPIKRTDIGYALNPSAWGKGLITEAGSTVVDYAFNTAGVDTVEALIFSRINPGSVRVVEKLGAEFIGKEPAVEYIGEEWIGFSRQFDLWLIQTASPDRVEDRLHDACFRFGMFSGEENADKKKSLETIENALKRNKNLIGSSRAKQIAYEAFEDGYSDPGWERYRISKQS